jgi:hypothetical protein
LRKGKDSRSNEWEFEEEVRELKARVEAARVGKMSRKQKKMGVEVEKTQEDDETKRTNQSPPLPPGGAEGEEVGGLEGPGFVFAYFTPFFLTWEPPSLLF